MLGSKLTLFAIAEQQIPAPSPLGELSGPLAIATAAGVSLFWFLFPPFPPGELDRPRFPLEGERPRSSLSEFSTGATGLAWTCGNGQSLPNRQVDPFRLAK